MYPVFIYDIMLLLLFYTVHFEGMVENMKTQTIRNSLLLLLTATIWGTAFVAQSVGMDHVGPFTFSFARCMLGAIVLVPVIFYFEKRAAKIEHAGHRPPYNKGLIISGVVCGVVLFIASSLQQFGIMFTSVGKAGFITACYIVLVPIGGYFLGKRCSPMVFLAVAIALVGLYMLCITDGFHIGLGDFLVFWGAIMFTVHILVIDHYAPRVDGVKLSMIQFIVCGLISFIAMILFEQPSVDGLIAAWMPIAYAGILSSGVGYTLQIIGQNGMNPTVASLILSLEACVSVLSGWLILGQQLTARELTGCVLMFCAIVLAQWPRKRSAV